MKIGKLSTQNLKKIIGDNKGAVREEVLVSSKIGEDCAIIKFGDEVCVLSTDPITAGETEVGKLLVNININDIASSGADAVALMITILAPENTEFEKIQRIMQDISDEAKKLNVQIVGGHTEITDSVKKIVVSATAIGKQSRDRVVTTSGSNVFDRILITKGIGIEGTGIIAHEKQEELKRVLSDEQIESAKSMLELLSVYKEGRIASKYSVSSMHDITEGGLFGAIWESCLASGRGCTLDLKNIPIKLETKKICEYFNINPYKLISSGSMLITIAENEANRLMVELQSNGIDVYDIGEITENGIMYIDFDGELKQIPEPSSDEIYKLV